MRSYCTKNKGRCWNCPLAKAGRDCQGNLAMWWDASQAAAAWGISTRRIFRLLENGGVPEAESFGESLDPDWKIPIDTPKPKLGFWGKSLETNI